MPGIEWTDFSGGMISDINEIVAPLNTFKNMQNADCWSEAGVVKGLTDFVILDSFPANKNYDHHVVFPAHGVKDYAIVMMHDGTIYSYDPTDAGSEFVSIGSVTAGARMAYANDRVYVFYRNMTAPTTGNTVRKVIEFDYVAETFSISDFFVDNRGSMGDITQITNGNLGNDDRFYKGFLTFKMDDSPEESYGIEFSGTLQNGKDNYFLLTRDADFEKARVYLSYILDSTGAETFLTPQMIFEIFGGSDKTYIPLITGPHQRNSGNHKQLWVEYDTPGGGTTQDNCFTDIISRHLAATEDYITTGHKLKINEVEYTIATITDDAANNRYVITVDIDLPDFAIQAADPGTNALVFLYVELAWDSNTFFIPVQARYRHILGIQVDETRPQSKFLSGTGNFLAPLGNYLFTANPYFPDLFNANEDLDKKGWLSWSWITGEGLYAFGLLPDVSLITSPGFSSEIIDMFAFKENLLVFHQGGLVRFVLESGVPFPFDSDQHGVDASFNYYVDKFRLFLYSNKQIKMAVFSRKNIEKGEFDFVELSRGIASLVSNASTNARFGYQPDAKLLHFTDTTDNVDNFICSLRNQKPAWVKWVNAAGNTGVEATMYNSFVLNGKVYFVGTDNSVYRIYEETSTYLQNLTVETHNTFIPLGNDYIRKVELVYQQASGSFVFDVYLDDVKVYTETITTVKSVPGFYEIRFPRTAVTRFSKLRWVLTKASVGADSFKLMGVFVNRDSYGRETQKGY
jgi:hypothetical protein